MVSKEMRTRQRSFELKLKGFHIKPDDARPNQAGGLISRARGFSYTTAAGGFAVPRKRGWSGKRLLDGVL